MLADAGAKRSQQCQRARAQGCFSRLVSQEDVMGFTYEAMRMYTGLTPDASQAEHQFACLSTAGPSCGNCFADGHGQLCRLGAFIDTDERVAAIKT